MPTEIEVRDTFTPARHLAVKIIEEFLRRRGISFETRGSTIHVTEPFECEEPRR